MQTKSLLFKSSANLTINTKFSSSIESQGKMPPQSIDIDQSILGALILEKDALTEVIDILKPANFYEEIHQEIYIAILQLFNASAPVDIRTVVNQLRKNGKLELVGGSY